MKGLVPSTHKKFQSDLQRRWLTELDWDDKGIIRTSQGSRHLYVCEDISDEFWDEWRSDKDELKDEGFSISRDDRTGEWVLKLWQIPGQASERQSSVESVEAVSYGNFNAIEPKGTALKNPEGLLSAQIPHVQKLLTLFKRQDNCVLDGSDVGAGKTVSTLALARELKLRPIIICSKSGKRTWYYWAEHLKMELEDVLNWEELKTGKTQYMDILKTKKKVRKYDGSTKEKKKYEIEWHVAQSCVLIFDEAHRGRGPDSINACMVMAARDQNISRMFATGSFVENPLQLYALGYAMNMWSYKKDFYRWIEGYGCQQIVFGERFRVKSSDPRANLRFWEFVQDDAQQQRYMNQLHVRLFHDSKLGPALGARMELKDLGFENQILPWAYEMDSASKIQAVYDRLAEQLEELRNLKKNAQHIFAYITAARREVELLKIPAIVEQTKDLIDEGRSVVIFVNFKETIAQLTEELEKIPHGIIDGETNQQDRIRFIDEFQKDKIRLMICNIKAGGESVSLHDVRGRYPRVSLVLPPYSATALIQSLGRIFRRGLMSAVSQRIIYAHNTIEDDVCAAVSRKIKNLSQLNNGDLRSAIFGFNTGLDDYDE